MILEFGGFIKLNSINNFSIWVLNNDFRQKKIKEVIGVVRRIIRDIIVENLYDKVILF